MIDLETRNQIKRMCDIILNSKPRNKELDSLALSVGHHPSVFNPNKKSNEVKEIQLYLKCLLSRLYSEHQNPKNNELLRDSILKEIHNIEHLIDNLNCNYGESNNENIRNKRTIDNQATH
jgi:hypothetical protein